MADIGEFAQEVARQYLARQESAQPQFSLGLLAPAVERLVRSVFYASMLPDEGRYPTVSLLSYRGDSDRELHLPLRPPLDPKQVTVPGDNALALDASPFSIASYVE